MIYHTLLFTMQENGWLVKNGQVYVHVQRGNENGSTYGLIMSMLQVGQASMKLLINIKLLATKMMRVIVVLT